MNKKIVSLLLVLGMIFCLGFSAFAAGTADDDNDLSADAFDPATGVELDKDTITVKAGATENLVATVLPSTAANKKVTWKSSDDTIATVANGVVTGVKAGTATITVTSVSGNFTDTCTVTVESAAIYGDVDDSGKVNVRDYAMLRKYILNKNSVTINMTNADCDKSGSVNVRDYAILRKHILNPVAFPLN